MASETFRPCPFCAAALSPCEDKGVVFWMHPGVITDDDCVLAGRGFYPKELPAWNRRAAVAELVEDMRPFVEGAAHTQVFLRSREKMHSAGQELYQEDVDRAKSVLSRHQAGLGKGVEQ